MPSWSILKSENVATPFTAVTVLVPGTVPGCGGNRSESARRLSISTRRLRRLLNGETDLEEELEEVAVQVASSRRSAAPLVRGDPARDKTTHPLSGPHAGPRFAIPDIATS